MPLVPGTQYAQPTDLQRFCLTPAQAGRFGADQQNNALIAASAIVDAYLNTQYVLPLIQWDDLLTIITCNVAQMILWNQYGYSPTQGGADQEIVKNRYASAIGWLDKVASKKISPNITDSSGLQPQEDSGGPFVVSDPAIGFGFSCGCGQSPCSCTGSFGWGW